VLGTWKSWACEQAMGPRDLHDACGGIGFVPLAGPPQPCSCRCHAGAVGGDGVQFDPHGESDFWMPCDANCGVPGACSDCNGTGKLPQSLEVLAGWLAGLEIFPMLSPVITEGTVLAAMQSLGTFSLLWEAGASEWSVRLENYHLASLTHTLVLALALHTFAAMQEA
jgi:hypothetical protein